MSKLSWEDAVTLYTNTFTWEKIKKAKSNGMSWIVDKPILKLRNDT